MMENTGGSSSVSIHSAKKRKIFISPSGFAGRYHFNCDRQLLFSVSHVGRSSWFMRPFEHTLAAWEPCNSVESVFFELAYLQTPSVALSNLLNFQVDMEKRCFHSQGIKYALLRTQWFYCSDNGDSASHTPNWSPLDESNSRVIEFSSTPTISLTINGMTYIYDTKTGIGILDIPKLQENTKSNPELKLDTNISQTSSNSTIISDIDKSLDLIPQKLKFSKRNGLQTQSRNLVSTAFTTNGDLWESKILEILALFNDIVHIGKPTSENSKDIRASDLKLSMDNFISILKSSVETISNSNNTNNDQLDGPTNNFTQNEGNRTWIYQPSLDSPVQLYERLGLSKDEIFFSKCFPDFLQLVQSPFDKKLEIIIVDAKATDKVKMSHRIQVGLYHFIISAILKSHKLDDKIRVSNTGGVWLRGHTNYTSIDLLPILLHLEQFFTSKWKTLTTLPLAEVPYDFSSKCSHCNYEDFCKKEAEVDNKQLTQIFSVTSSDRDLVQSYLASKGLNSTIANILDIEDIYKELKRHSDSSNNPIPITIKQASSFEDVPSSPSKNSDEHDTVSTSIDESLSSLTIEHKINKNETNIAPTTSGESTLITSESQLSSEHSPQIVTPSISSTIIVTQTNPQSQQNQDIESQQSTPSNTQSTLDYGEVDSQLMTPVSGTMRALSNIVPEHEFYDAQSPWPHQSSLSVISRSSSSSVYNSPSNLANLSKRSSSNLSIQSHQYSTLSNPNLNITSMPNEPINQLSRPLWIIMTKLGSHIYNSLMLLNTPSTTISSKDEDIAMCLNFVQDRPNGHLAGFSIYLTQKSSTKTPKFNSLFSLLNSALNQIKDPQISYYIQPTDNFNLSLTVFLTSFLDANSNSVSELHTQLISLLHIVLDWLVTSTAAKSIHSIYTFAPSDSLNLRNILTQEITKRYELINNSQIEDNIYTKACNILISLFEDSHLLGLPSKLPKIEKTRPNTLRVVRTQLLNLFAFPLPYDADFDDFYRALVIPNNLNGDEPALKAWRSTRQNQSGQKPLLQSWYSLVHNKVDPKFMIENMHVLLDTKSKRLMSMISSIRSIFKFPAEFFESGVGPTTVLHQSINPFPLLLGSSSRWSWRTFSSIKNPKLAKLSFATKMEQLMNCRKWKDIRKSVCFNQQGHLHDRLIMLRFNTSMQIQNPKTGKLIQVRQFEILYASDVSRATLDRDMGKDMSCWALGSSEYNSIRYFLQFDDFAHSFSSRPFLNPFGVAFVKPICFSSSNLISLSVPGSFAEAACKPGSIFLLSEYELYATYAFIDNALYNIDLRSGYMNSLSRLHDLSIGKQVDRLLLNRFLDWFRAFAENLDNLNREIVLEDDFKQCLNAIGGFEGLGYEIKNSHISDSNNQQTVFNITWNLDDDLSGKCKEALIWAIEEFRGVATCGTKLPMQILENPLDWGVNMPGDAKDCTDDIKRALELSSESKLYTKAQLDVFKAVVEHKLTLVWGPPGTGKTYFLANLILIFLESHREINFIEKEVPVQLPKTPKKTKPRTSKKTSSPKTSTPSSLPRFQSATQLSDIDLLADEIEQILLAPPSTPIDAMTEAEQIDYAINQSIILSRQQSASELSTSKSTPNKNAISGDIDLLAADPPHVEQVSSEQPTTSNEQASPPLIKKLPSPEKVNEEIPPKLVLTPVATGTPFRILLVAFTHNAVDNLLDKFLEQEHLWRNSSNPLCKSDVNLPIGRMYSNTNKSKSSRWFSPSSPSVQSYTDSLESLTSAAELESFLDMHPQCMVACGVYTFKYATMRTSFDMMIIDEASQMLLAQSMMPLQFLNPSGRLILAGDDEQLPPIFNLELPPNNEEVSRLAGSVFKYFKSFDKSSVITRLLFENWRSCEALVQLPQNTIYATPNPEQKYRPANSTVANQAFYLRASADGSMLEWNDSALRKVALNRDSLSLTPQKLNLSKFPIPIKNPLIRLALDSSKPFVVYLVKASQNPSQGFPQSPLIAALCSTIRNVCNLVQPMSDHDFWASQLLVVAPHHVQRHQIRLNLMDTLRSWSFNWDQTVVPSIDTVEKAQGKEFDAVILDYAMLSPLRIANELSFLYSRNRLNVGITRARTKCIMFLSDTLLYHIEQGMFVSPEVIDGFKYLHSILDYAKEQGSLMEINESEIPTVCQEMSDDKEFWNFIQDLDYAPVTIPQLNLI